MCGRVTQSSYASDFADKLGVKGPLPNMKPRYNLCPTEQALVCRVNPETKERSLDLLHFGLVPHFAKDKSRQASLINAKSETIADKPSFRAAFRKRRGLLPIDSFFEWKAEGKVKQPYLIRRVDTEPMMLACIWENWQQPEYSGWYRSFSIVTTQANALMATLHDRMPVVLDEKDWPVWLGEEEGDYAAVMQPYDAEQMEMYRVSRDVSYVKNDGPSLVERVV